MTKRPFRVVALLSGMVGLGSQVSCTTDAPAAAAPGMVAIAEGRYTIGANAGEAANARPRDVVTVHGFQIDRTEVTNADFARFVEATAYRTTAEQPVDWATLSGELPPGTPRPSEEALQPGSLVFVSPASPVPLNDERAWWQWTPGADWRHPEGPASSIVGRAAHPVVQVSHTDASAYCAWAGKRLPTDVEWEVAARGGLTAKRYAWGDEPVSPDRANVWEGEFPLRHAMHERDVTTAVVGSYPANGYGLSDMTGNVWEWTADRFDEATLPDGRPADERIVRGGSFLCHPTYCAGYEVAARMHSSATTSLQNTGFRCAADRPRSVSSRSTS